MDMSCEAWNERWVPKIMATVNVLRERKESSHSVDEVAFADFIERSLHVPNENYGVRRAFIKMIRDTVKQMKDSQHLTYIMGARARLPYDVRFVISMVAEQVYDDAIEFFRNGSRWTRVLSFRKQTYHQPVDGNYDIMEKVVADVELLSHREYARNQSAGVTRKLTQYYKQGIWDGTEEQLLDSERMCMNILDFEHGVNNHAS